MKTRIPARLARGISRSTNGITTTQPSSQAPCKIVDNRVFAPASTLALLRTMTPVIGSTPRQPQIRLPMPCAASSRSYFVRTPECIASTAVAHSSVSAEAIRASENAATSTAFQPSRSVGSAAFGQVIASVRFSGSPTF